MNVTHATHFNQNDSYNKTFKLVNLILKPTPPHEDMCMHINSFHHYPHTEFLHSSFHAMQ